MLFRSEPVRANRQKLRMHLTLVSSFFVGALCGALGFKFLGYVTTVPLAVTVLLLVWRAVLSDVLERLPHLK